MKMNKRLLSLILVVVMVLGMFPLAAIATDDTTPEVTHIEGCSAECANAEGTCTCTCHTPAPVDDDPVDNCENCDDPACTGCTPAPAPLSNGGEEEDPLCDKCNATRNEDNTISHEPTCEKLQYVPTCTGKTGCPVENCPNQHCTGDENCPIENCECKQPKTPVCTGDPATCEIADCTCKQPKEPVIDGGATDPLCDQCEATKEGEKIVHADGCPNKPLCDKCGTTEKNEDGTPKHAEKCEELCLCEAVIEGYHSNMDCPFYVEPAATETTVALCEKCGMEECVCELEGLYLMKGAEIYKDYTDSAETPKVIDKWNTGIKVKETITAEDGTIWYSFAYTSFWAELFNGYKYVRMDDTTEFECSCNSVDGVHSEECAFYVEILEFAPVVYPEIHKSVYDVVISGGAVTTFARRSGGVNISSSVATAEEVYALGGVPASHSRNNEVWSGMYRIEASSPTIITMSNLPEIDGKIVEVRHYLDDADAVRSAIANGTAKFYGTENALFAAELAAVKEATNGEMNGVICYVVLSSENEEVLIEDRTISFYTDTYSLFEVNIVFVTPTANTQAAEVNNTGSGVVGSDAVVTDKNVKATDDGYELILESYVTGSKNTTEVSRTVASDIVLTVDLSASMTGNMDGCGEAEHDNTMSKHARSRPELDKNKVYYLDETKGMPVYYCNSCGHWYDTKHSLNNHGGQWYEPISSGYYNGEVFYTEKGNVESAVDADEVSTEMGYYFLHDGTDWLYHKYCTKCEAWIHASYLVGIDTTFNEENYGHFDEHGNELENGTHYGGSKRLPTASTTSKLKYAPFYDACVPSRLEAAKVAMKAFLDQVYESAKGPDGVWGTGDDVQHRVAITAFSGLYSYWGDQQTTGVYSVYDPENPDRLNTFYPYYQLEDEFNGADSGTQWYGEGNNKEPYKYSLRTVTNANERIILQNAVDRLAIQYGTNTDYGVNMAKSIFNHNPTTERTKMFVAFTDGQPERGWEKSDPVDQGKNYGTWGETGAAEPSLQYSYDLKQQGVTVYSVGIMSGADGTLKNSLHAGNPDDRHQDNVNKYMHLLSSNYPYASTMEHAYTTADLNSALKNSDGTIKDNNAGYYLSASTSEELKDAFVSIAEQIPDGGADIQLGSSTEVRDYITNDFYIPDGETVSVHTETYGGNDTSGNMLWTDDGNSETFTAQVDGNAVTVSGFDFSANYVGIDESTDLSGTTVKTPHGKKLVITIPIKTTSKGGNDLPTNTAVSGIYMPNNVEDPLDDTPVEYFPIPQVDVMTTITVKKNVVGKLHVNSFGFETKATTFDNYSIGTDSSGEPIIGNGPAKDLTAVATVKESSNSLTNGGQFSITNVKVGTPIEITEGNVEKYTLSVVAKDSQGNDITSTVNPVVSGGKVTVNQVVPEMILEFTNTSKTADLTITKNISGEAKPDQSFLFEVIGDGKTIHVVLPAKDFVNGSASVTLKELEIDEYTINEKIDWSWRYKLTGVTATVDNDAAKNGNGITVDLTPDNETVYFTNERDNIYWLDGESYAENVFAGKKPASNS